MTNIHLQTLFQFNPQQHAIFIHPKINLLASHQSTDYIAFVSRNNQAILHNTKTGKSSIILKSQNGIASLIFTHQYLLIVQINIHEILAFSLKNQKLKKKITGHRTQVTKVAYCRNTRLIASLSHDQLIIVNQSNFDRQKMIKCSTSTFADCSFSLSGNILATVFTDGSIYLWNPEDYTHRQSSLPYKNLKVSLNINSTIIIYNSQRLFLGDVSKQTIIYQQIDRFWKGNINNINFINGYILVHSENAFYLADIKLQHQFIIKSIRQFGQIDAFTVAQYQSIFIFIYNKLKKICISRFTDDLQEIIKEKQYNPLTNQGLICAGGYSNSQGCFIHRDLHNINNYNQVTQQLEKINRINYQPLSTTFNKEKLQQFIRKHHCLPDKHRPMAYRYLLKLPISPQQFRILQQKGRHESAALLQAKYPLQNKQLAQVMKDIISLLAYYNPVFAEAEFIPTLIFPFVCIFGNDYLLCFQILYRLFTRPLSFLFKQFPVANSTYLQNIRQIMSHTDPELLNHFTKNGISFTKACWTLLTTLFSTCLARENYLAIIDCLFVRIDEPQYIIFLLLGFLTYNRARIFSIDKDNSLSNFLDQEQSMNLGKYLTIVEKIAIKQRKNIRYNFEVVNLQEKNYLPLNQIPQDALKMYENKRKILTEELLKRQQEQKNRDDMLKQMERMALLAKRQSERQLIQKQAYDLHCQVQSEQKIKFNPRDDKNRILRIQQLVDQLTYSLENQQSAREKIKNYLPSITNLELKSNEELDRLQLKLSKLLTQIKPKQSNHYLKSQPLAVQKQGISNHNAFKAAVNTRLAGQIWGLESNIQANNAKRWQNNMLSSLNT